MGDDGEQVQSPKVTNVVAAVDYKECVAVLVKEYFDSADCEEVRRSLKELRKPLYHHYLVKCLVKSAMDRTPKELEMAAQLLATLSDDVLEPGQVSKGFVQLLESIQDQTLDVPEAPHMLELFLVRASVDDILPPAFLKVCAGSLPEERARGIVKAALRELGTEGAVDRALHVWGSTQGRTVDQAQHFIRGILDHYLNQGGVLQDVQTGLHQLALPFFHHEFVKTALLLSVSEPESSPRIMPLLKSLVTSRALSSSQVAKGLARAEETVYETYDGEDAETRFEALTEQARLHGLSEGDDDEEEEKEEDGEDQDKTTKTRKEDTQGTPFKSASLDLLNPVPSPHTPEELANFKEASEMIIREYLVSGSLEEASTALQETVEQARGGSELVPHFVKRVVTVALDRAPADRERAAQLLSALYPTLLSSWAIKCGLVSLCRGVDDLSLDIKDAVSEVATFLARAAVDDLLSPRDMADINQALKGSSPLSQEVLETVGVLLGPRHAAERVLRHWGGSEAGTVAHCKAEYTTLLKEFVASGDLQEARRCLHALHVPHFHHELVKQALRLALEDPQAQAAVLTLLKALGESMEINTSQMTKGFDRMKESVDDLSLDVPGARENLSQIEAQAKSEHFLSA